MQSSSRNGPTSSRQSRLSTVTGAVKSLIPSMPSSSSLSTPKTGMERAADVDTDSSPSPRQVEDWKSRCRSLVECICCLPCIVSSAVLRAAAVPDSRNCCRQRRRAGRVGGTPLAVHEGQVTFRSGHVMGTEGGRSRTYMTGVRLLCEGRFLSYMLWAYRAPFLPVIMAFFLLYFLWVIIFAIILYGLEALYYDSHKGLDCMSGWQAGEDGWHNFEISLSLSWTTLSTVGYGGVSPSTMPGCILLRCVAAVEAFVGVLYASFAGAILFAKVVRLHSGADVTFSAPLCLTYGTGVQDVPLEAYGTDLSEIRINMMETPTHTHHPVLEFRVVNNRSNERSAEIINAEIICIVSINKDPSIGTSSSSARSRVVASQYLPAVARRRAGNLNRNPLAKGVYFTLSIEPDRHPFFRNIWYARHVLDGDSPLVSPEIKRAICSTGRWPQHVASPPTIRENIVNFENIVVTFKGSSTITNQEVFAKKLFKKDDICIGWQHANVCYSLPGRMDEYDDTEKVLVDFDRVHDIVPQQGGGEEDISDKVLE